MKKKIACPHCSGRGSRVVITGDRKDYCGVAHENCPECGGRGFVEAEMTISDKIRTMSDEELAVFWNEHYDDFCQSKTECSEYINEGREIPESWCVACALQWLKKSAEVKECSK